MEIHFMNRYINCKKVFDFKPMHTNGFDDCHNCHNPLPPRPCCDFYDFWSKNNCPPPKCDNNFCHSTPPFCSIQPKCDNNFCSRKPPFEFEHKKCEPDFLPPCSANTNSLLYFVIGYLIGNR